VPPWNKGRKVGQKRALRPPEVWLIRDRLREVDRLVEERSQQTDPGVRKRLVWEIEQKAPNITNAGEIAELDSLSTRWREMDSNHLSRDKWERCSEARPIVRSPG